MFSNWRELLSFPAFPSLKRHNSEPELNSPNFEAFSDDEWILVNEKIVLSEGLEPLKLAGERCDEEDCAAPKESNDLLRNGDIKLNRTTNNTTNSNPDGASMKRTVSSSENTKKVTSNATKACKTKSRQQVDARIQQRRQLEELLFENNNTTTSTTNYNNNGYNNANNNYYKAVAKATRSHLRRRQRQTDPRGQAKFCNDTRRRRRRDMSC